MIGDWLALGLIVAIIAVTMKYGGYLAENLACCRHRSPAAQNLLGETMGAMLGFLLAAMIIDLIYK